VPSSPSAAVDDALVIAGRGDIAEAGASTMVNATSTADRVRAAKRQVVFTEGDNAYPDGSATDYTKKYDPAWGSFHRDVRP
jgi:alkaline phosphatase